MPQENRFLGKYCYGFSQLDRAELFLGAERSSYWLPSVCVQRGRTTPREIFHLWATLIIN